MSSTAEPATPWDVSRAMHKAIRLALFRVTVLAGAADAGDDDSVDRLLGEWRDAAFVLRGHHGHEDEFWDPLITLHAPDLRDDLEAAHRLADASLADLDRLAIKVAHGGADRRDGLLQLFHLDLAAFTAVYLDHLRVEEDEVLPRLEARIGAELDALTVSILGSVPPAELDVFLRYLIPSINPAERHGLLSSLEVVLP